MPYVLLNCNYKTSNVWTKSIKIFVAILLLLESLFYLNGGYYKLTYKPYVPNLTFIQDAKPAVDYILQHKLPQPIFNNFDIGSYIIYRGYPEYKVFIDGRPEAFPASFFTKTYIPLQENYSIFKKEENKFGFKTVIFSITDQNPRTLKFLNSIIKDPDWKIIFLDQFVIVFVKTNIQQDLKLQTIDLEKININQYNYSTSTPYTNLSTFLFNMHYLKQAEAINQKALKINPDNPAANNIMAFILYFKKENRGIIQDYYSKSNNAIFW